MVKCIALLILFHLVWISRAPGQTDTALRIHVNQVALDTRAPKMAVIESDYPLILPQPVSLLDREGNILEAGILQGTYRQEDWTPYKYLYRVDFSAMRRPGTYRLLLVAGSHMVQSDPFAIGDDTLADLTIPAILHYYRRQRANTPTEWSVDAHIPLFRSNQTGGTPQTVDMRGGWCDASGDVSKYFSHLAYANVMSPQQTPLVTWSLAESRDAVPGLLNRLGVLDSITDEALWGADYMMRALSPQDYFYMIVFSYFNKDPNARRVVGLLANSVTDTDYACAFREGGGMAIAALARISKWKRDGAFTSRQYLEGAERAFAHLLINNTRYDDDGKENIIDDYCALMAATELWIATDSLPESAGPRGSAGPPGSFGLPGSSGPPGSSGLPESATHPVSTLTAIYRLEARRRASSLESRLGPQGYFFTDSTRRPFWHASDAGLPIVALARYLDAETDPGLRQPALQTIRRHLDYLLRVTRNVPNPYGYARQTLRYQGKIMDGFFIPHDNETGWWWQGENARLASLATAALVGGRLVYGVGGGAPPSGAMDSLAECQAFAQRQLNWILGCNPYSICFMYGFGQHNVPYMQSNFGHGSEKGGISNGITGKEGRGDGGGIDFKTQDNGNEWRWTEQWIPHAAWFLQAVTALSQQE